MTAIVSTGCAAAQGLPPPSDGLRAYCDAVQAGNVDAAYAQLSENARRHMSRAAFGDALAQNRTELATLLPTISSTREDGIRTEARVQTSGDETVSLVLRRGKWQLENGFASAPNATTPRDAVLAMRRAIARRDLESVLRLLSRKPRTEILAEMEHFVSATEDASDLDVEIDGDHARVRLDADSTIELLREGGEWRVLRLGD